MEAAGRDFCVRVSGVVFCRSGAVDCGGALWDGRVFGGEWCVAALRAWQHREGEGIGFFVNNRSNKSKTFHPLLSPAPLQYNPPYRSFNHRSSLPSSLQTPK